MIISMIVGVAATVSLVLLALNKDINLYYTPSQLRAIPLPKTNLRLGGVVKRNSLKRELNALTIKFILTDYAHEILVKYTGILPSLFREGQGVVVEGHFNNGQWFEAS